MMAPLNELLQKKSIVLGGFQENAVSKETFSFQFQKKKKINLILGFLGKKEEFIGDTCRKL